MARIYTNGFEFLTVTNNFLAATSGVNVTRETSVVRKSTALNGGLASLRLSGNTSSATSSTWPYNVTSFWIRWGYRTTNTTLRTRMRIGDATGTWPIYIEQSTGGTLDIYYNSVLRATSSISISANTWYRCELYVSIATSGELTLRIDDTQRASWTGATNTILTSINRWNAIGVDASVIFYLDDMAVNTADAAIYYASGSGTAPTVGNTLSDTATGTITGTIKAYEGDGTKGILYVTVTAGTFTGSLAIQDGGGFTATTSFAQSNANNSWPGEGFIQILAPTGAGSTTGLTPSTGANWSCVDDNETTSDTVTGTSSGLYDTYAIANLPSDATSIKHVMSCVYAQKDTAGIDYIVPVFRPVSTDRDGHKKTVGTSYSWVTHDQHLNPETGNGWTVSEINGTQFGPKISS